MKIAIIETGHFQYTLTLSEIFSEYKQIIITTKQFQEDIFLYDPAMKMHKYVVIESIDKNKNEILAVIQKEQIDILHISPIFDSYKAMKEIVKQLKCTKVLTTHNINTWFNGRFWSPHSLMDRINMRAIINNCDYIAVEDFIYNYLKNSNHKYFLKYKFIYIPFTVFYKTRNKKYQKQDDRLKVVLTGAIDGDRRRYEEILNVIDYFKNKSDKITFSFAGRAKGEYGIGIQNKLRVIKEEYPKLVSFFENNSTIDMFIEEMETSDLVLSTSTKKFKGMGTTEYIGKTKPTAAIHDMITFQLPGLLPEHLTIPENLKGSVFNYNNSESLINILNKLIEDKTLLSDWKEKSKNNSLNFTSEIIRKKLPF
ncbi:MAG: hypothetical protein LBV69_09010 [Bacteroidales bacterium]|jgi:hypothetical protein|nr:hypothetical protein [Bacteroidales bacterium]